MTEEVQKKPIEILANNIKKFTQDIEGLHTSLPLLMTIVSAANKASHEKFDSFINEHAIDKIVNGEELTYSVQINDISRHNKLKRHLDNLTVATKLIPRHFITSLVSQYDSFLGCVIRFIFFVKPQILNASEKTIAYTDLIQFANITEAREYIIEKEVETIIRKSHPEQFNWLKEKLGTPFNKDLKSWPVFVELTERRNLFVHCDGRVSSQYLKICSEHKCEIDSALTFGDQLEVAPRYFENAYRCIYEIGFKLAHVVWRRLSPEYVKESDTNIIEVTYGLIEKREFDLAIRILEFFTDNNIKHSNDNNKRTMIINLAQAFKWSNDQETCQKILDQFDWTACGDNFRLAVVVLEEKYNVAYTIMRRLKNDDTFHKNYYKDWPLFKELRKQEGFPSVYEECYGEAFKVQQKTDEEKNITGEQYKVDE